MWEIDFSDEVLEGTPEKEDRSQFRRPDWLLHGWSRGVSGPDVFRSPNCDAFIIGNGLRMDFCLPPRSNYDLDHTLYSIAVC